MDANSNPNPLSTFGQPTPSVAPEFQGFGHPTESTPSLFAPSDSSTLGGFGFRQPQRPIDALVTSAIDVLCGFESLNTTLFDASPDVPAKVEAVINTLQKALFESEKLKAKLK